MSQYSNRIANAQNDEADTGKLAGRRGRGSASATLEQGRVIASHGRHYVVAPQGGAAALQCFPRGKRSEMAVGDEVTFERQSADQGVIVDILPRRNLLFRSDQFKSKLFAANLDQMLIMLATEPWFSEDLLGRSLVAAEASGIAPLILLNKADLPEALVLARERLAPYVGLGYQVVEGSVTARPEEAESLVGGRLRGRTTLLLGQSGMGKSTLVNLLVPGAAVATREISVALNSGRHTTTFTRLYQLPGGGALIDSPGFQEFGLHHLTEGMLERAFPEFRSLLPHCRFYNCRHLHEPGCAILDGVEKGKIGKTRHALYEQLVHEASQIVR
ncbi:ribosome small subunit-dependent GTPase A [Pararobbsia alpina]|uniref:Small ribosomal subunit biogenesis GTPase RsgA n=1 Tax=Pararobbsia alpina TaxID=621374 RepID=A0A6S7CJA8_9BURK|nr:ribosome small subunit-dependent GTPase A [Pararobbsia alpina]CAB3781401.1 Small ribosomal subunit biogenesis GTPase RsgA [Pararobbsia alpina]